MQKDCNYCSLKMSLPMKMTKYFDKLIDCGKALLSLNSLFEPAEFYLFDAMGYKVKHRTLLDHLTLLDIHPLPNGLYLWRVEISGELIGLGKLQVQR